MLQVEVIRSAERRHRWSRAEKERLIAACFEPGATASQVARSAGIHASQLFDGARSCVLDRPRMIKSCSGRDRALIGGAIAGVILSSRAVRAACVMVPARPFFSGSPGWVRSSA